MIALRFDVDEDLRKTAEAALYHAVANAEVGSGELFRIRLQRSSDGWKATMEWQGTEWRYEDNEIADQEYSEDDWLRRRRELVRLGILEVMQAHMGLAEKPWGILTGVRPTKMVHNMMDRGFSRERMYRLLTGLYAVDLSRAKLILDVASGQRPFFPENFNDRISVYIGVPFCPTRCSYCSFAAYPLGSHGHLVKGFLASLMEEMAAMGRFLHEHDRHVDSVYLGGGTPTTLQGEDLQSVLDGVKRWFPPAAGKEFCVEAGRPETLNKDTWSRLAAAGVTRVSINPQTMNDDTLRRVGRRHTADDVRIAFADARRAGIPLINSDIILGLPGETMADVEATLEHLEPLQPDHVTVHSLAWKRAAEWDREAQLQSVQVRETRAMVDRCAEVLQRRGLKPYYLYRQRDIVGGLENVGYCRPGTESWYNIVMMEERQTILGLGAGAITKYVAPNGRIWRTANPKCPATYGQGAIGLVAEKQENLSRLWNV